MRTDTLINVTLIKLDWAFVAVVLHQLETKSVEVLGHPCPNSNTLHATVVLNQEGRLCWGYRCLLCGQDGRFMRGGQRCETGTMIVVRRWWLMTSSATKSGSFTQWRVVSTTSEMSYKATTPLNVLSPSVEDNWTADRSPGGVFVQITTFIMMSPVKNPWRVHQDIYTVFCSHMDSRRPVEKHIKGLSPSVLSHLQNTSDVACSGRT